MLDSGSQLGTYQIVALIGAGGMGEVYQARDSKLNRDVAIKVLPEQFARDAERLARFQREAQMLAALNHPNIAAIYGLEQSGNIHYLIMELVPGDTLAQRLKRDGPLPLEEALHMARQIAEALEAAHEKPIIHRDLKPANVKVTPEGRVKVLDFGLAKAYAAEAAPEDVGNSPTLSMAATRQGVILGTASYMSPEQAKGKQVNKSTDIWAFGVVLYELLTGKQAFEGEDIGDILATVVKSEPDWSRLPESTPPAIQTLLRRCLRKDRRQRLQDATGIRIEIEEALAAPATAAAPAAVPAKSRRWLSRQVLISGLAMLFLGLLIAGIAAWKLKPDPPRLVTRTVITLPQGDQLAAQDYPALALSPDGTQLAYVAIRNGFRQIYLRPLDSLEARPLLGTEGAGTPFFSPDGHWLGFTTVSKLAKISVTGGAAVTLAPVAAPRGAAWNINGTIAFSTNGGSALQKISDAGGAPQALTQLDKGETGHRWPEFLPGGNAFLYAAGGSNPQVVVQSLTSGERHDLAPGGLSPRYLPSGHLLYLQGGNLMAAPFDPQRLQLTGAAVPVVEGVLQASVSGGAQYAISSAGSLAYIAGGVQAAQRLVWVTRNGVEQPLPAPPHNYLNPRISPDGRRIAVWISDQGGSQVWLYDLARETLTRFTFQGSVNGRPVWTPDGKRVAFDSNKESVGNLYWQLADGSGGLERLTTSENQNFAMSWSDNGQLLAIGETRPNTGRDVSVLRLSDHKVQPFLETSFIEGAAAFSPDGHWLAYSSDESGRTEVYVQPYPGPGGKWQVSTEGGAEPVWNRNGRELFYRSGDKMMSVEVSTQPTFSIGKPKLLFTGQYVPTAATISNYDVSPDGQRFLMVKANEQGQATTQINVVLNFTEELKRRVPTAPK